MIKLNELFKKIHDVNEEMTSGGGTIAGMGANLGKPPPLGPPPDDVKISTDAQSNYSASNSLRSPPNMNMPNRRRRLAMLNINRPNVVGREAY